MLTGTFGTVDDLIRATYKDLLHGDGLHYVQSRKGASTERFGALVKLTNPKARLSRSVGRARIFSALGEVLWYLSGTDAVDQIEYYIRGYSEFSDDGGKTVNGAYGKRLFCSKGYSTEWKRIIDLLSKKERQGSRNAVIQVLENHDLRIGTKDRPCTTTLQFVVRENRLQLHVHMRSNDVYLGLPHDIFSFTMLQEIAAKQLDLELGPYFHSVGSLHLYDDTEKEHDPKPRSNASAYLAEQYMGDSPMPSMPDGNPWDGISALLEAEAHYREGKLDKKILVGIPEYWNDLACLLRAYAAIKYLNGAARLKLLEECRQELQEESYKLYVLDQIAKFEFTR